jgi:hypothetical protein
VTGTTSTVEFEDNDDAIDAKPDPSVFIMLVLVLHL